MGKWKGIWCLSKKAWLAMDCAEPAKGKAEETLFHKHFKSF